MALLPQRSIDCAPWKWFLALCRGCPAIGLFCRFFGHAVPGNAFRPRDTLRPLPVKKIGSQLKACATGTVPFEQPPDQPIIRSSADFLAKSVVIGSGGSEVGIGETPEFMWPIQHAVNLYDRFQIVK